MKKVVGIVLLIAVIAIGIYFFIRYENSKDEPHGTFVKPRLEYSSITLYHIAPTMAKARLHFLIDNPMPIGLSLDSVSYDLYIEGVKVFTSTHSVQLELEPSDSSMLTLPLTIFRDSLELVQEQAGPRGGQIDTVTYKLDVEFYTELPLLEDEKFKISYEFRSPLFRSPSVDITDWSFKGIESGDAMVILQLRVINYNVFNMEYKNINYQLILGDGESVLSGSKPGKVLVEKRDTAYLSLPFKLDIDDAASAAWDYISKSENLGYRFSATLEQVSKTDVTDEGVLEIVATGNFKTLQERIAQ